MEMTPVASSNIEAIGYDADRRELHIAFKDGGHYVYSDVGQHQYNLLMAAESLGRHFHANIKGKFAHKKAVAPTAVPVRDSGAPAAP